MSSHPKVSKMDVKKKVEGNKQLIESFVMQRFFRQWILTVFGKASPLIASKHHNKVLRQRYFGKWKSLQLTRNQNWKLQIRAEYHDRYRLWSYSFQSWKKFVIISKASKEKLIKAENHRISSFTHKFTVLKFEKQIMYGNRFLLSKVVKGLHQYLEMRQKKKTKQIQAKKYHSQVLQRCKWKLWLKQHNKNLLMRHLTYISLNHWSFQIKKRMFEIWKRSYMEQCNLNQRLILCSSYYNSKKAKIIFLAWQSYLESRRLKRNRKDYAVSCYTTCLLRSCLRKWKTQYQHQANVKLLETQIKTLGERSVKRRCLVSWKNYIEKRHFHQIQKEAANDHFKKKTRMNVFGIWIQASLLAKERRLNENKADLFHLIQIQFTHFEIWKTETERREDIKSSALFKIADMFHKNQVYTKCIYGWIKYVKKRKLFDRKTTLANNHFNQKLIPRCFSHWKEFIDLQKVQDKRKLRADAFNREVVFAKYFYLWLKEYQQVAINEEAMEKAMEACNQNIMKTSYRTWVTQWKIQQIRNNLKIKSLKFNQRKSFERFFFLWKENWRKTKISERNTTRALNHLNNHLLYRCWRAFRKYHQICLARKLKDVKADKHAENCLQRKVFQSLRLFTESSRKRTSIADQMYTDKSRLVQRYFLFKWKEHVAEQQKERQAVSRAQNFYFYWLKKKAFLFLKEYSNRKIEQRFWDDEATIRTQMRLNNGLSRRVFLDWKEKTIQQSHLNKKMQVVRQHYGNRLKVKVVHTLKLNLHLQLKEKMLMTKCAVFYTRNLQLKFFTIWYHKHAIVQEEYRKTNIALFWWSVQLQKKTLDALKRYKEISLRKKLDYKQALLFRRELLIEKGVDKWIEFSNNAMERRRRIAYNMQVKQCMALQSRVRRFAMHWLRVTQRSCAQHGNENKNSTSSVYLPDTGNVIMGALSKSTFAYVSRNEENRFTQITKEATSKRFQKFNVGFPTKKARRAPRQPSYLRDSYDLKNIRDDGDSSKEGFSGMSSSAYCRDVTTDASHPCPPSTYYDVYSRADVLELSDDEAEEKNYSTTKIANRSICCQSIIVDLFQKVKKVKVWMAKYGGKMC